MQTANFGGFLCPDCGGNLDITYDYDAVAKKIGDSFFNGPADIFRFAALLPFNDLTSCADAARLLSDAIAKKERLLIVADYDADGATACALGISVLRQLGADIGYLVPNRFEHGYGLTPEIVDLAAAQSARWIITVDNGIASVDGVARANELGIGVLVTDHHLPGDTLPKAACIVNPNQPDDSFPSKNLAGVGVMFYVLLALRAELRARDWFATRPEPNLADQLDLVALGTVADVVPLDANNRTLVTRGLERIRGSARRIDGGRPYLSDA